MKVTPFQACIVTLASAATLCAACDDDIRSVAVQVVLDPETCATTEPDDVFLSCDATAGVWLRLGSSGRSLDQECVDLGGTAENDSLGQLRTLLADFDLSTYEWAIVSAEVAVYSPWTAAQGCLPPDQLVAKNGPEIIMSGSSQPRSLLDVHGSLEVVLYCEGTQRTSAKMCGSDCDVEWQECTLGVAASACGEKRDACFESCGDEICSDVCRAQYDDCLSETVDGRCWGAFVSCTSGCGGDAKCLYSCGPSFDQCIDQDCGEQHDECEVSCPDPQCAFFPDDR